MRKKLEKRNREARLNYFWGSKYSYMCLNWGKHYVALQDSKAHLEVSPALTFEQIEK